MTDYSLLYRPGEYTAAPCGFFVDKELAITHYKNACILPYKKISGKTGGGVITKNGDYLSNSSGHNGAGCGYLPAERKISDRRAIYLGMFQPIWGHLITDVVRRFWFLQSDQYKTDYQDCILVYIAYPGFSFIENFKQLLSIWNIEWDKFVEINEPTEFREVIIPDESFYTVDGGARYFTAEYRDMIDQVRAYAEEHYTELKDKKIYFAYSSGKMHGLMNKTTGEDRIHHLFEQKGYTIIYPEKHTLFDQLNILINATDFASTVGSCSHNILFLRDGTNVTLIPRANYLTGYQQAINEIHELNIRYVDATLSLFVPDAAPWNGPFFFFVSKNLYQALGMDPQQAEKKSNYRGFRRYKTNAILLCNDTDCKKAFH